MKSTIVGNESSTASRRELMGRALRLAGGGALAVGFISSPALTMVASAQDDGLGGGGRSGGGSGEGIGGGGRMEGGAGGGGRTRQADQGGQGGQGGALPSVGVGSAVAGSHLPEMLGLAAAGVAAVALIARRDEATATSKS